MDVAEIIKTRRSVRTFDGRMISHEDRDRLEEFIGNIRNPYDIPVQFVLLDAKQYGLSSPVLEGDTLYVAGKVEKVPHAEEAFGYSFEQLVLYAWSLGIGTTWIAGTMKRELFEAAAGVKEGERMYCMSPLGYPAKKMTLKETLMRKGVKADERKPASELFFEKDFATPLLGDDEALEMVRLAPSAVNVQPWRVVRDGNAFHFYEKHSGGYDKEPYGDLQKVDMGIALCHFMMTREGKLVIEDPRIPAEADIEYIATVLV